MKTTLTKLDIQELLILAEDIYNDFLNKIDNIKLTENFGDVLLNDEAYLIIKTNLNE